MAVASVRACLSARRLLAGLLQQPARAVASARPWAARRLSSAPPRRSGLGGGGGGLGGGAGPRQLPLFALPSWRIARKSEEELEAAVLAGEAGSARFPFKDEFEVAKGSFVSGEQVVGTLSPLMTAERVARIEAVCAARTFNVLPIVEHIYDMGNLAAICRSADALGFGALHVVRNLEDSRYKQSKRSSAGADKWLDVQVYDTTEECLRRAKRLGYQVVATSLGPGSVPISQIDWTRPTAFVLGNEEKGVSAEAVALADATCAVPMHGFVDSFNISVAASLLMYEARRCREERLGAHGDLSEEERALLKAVFFLRNKGQSREYIQHMLARPPPHWQSYRGGGDWGGKEFEWSSSGSGSEDEAGGSSSGDAAAQAPTPTPKRLTPCHYWDGSSCYGERLLWPGKECRYNGAHFEGRSTLNKEKLKQQCERRGVAFPDLANPPPLPPALLERRQAAADAAAAAAAAEAAAVEAAGEGSREAHAALLAAAAGGAGAAPQQRAP